MFHLPVLQMMKVGSGTRTWGTTPPHAAAHCSSPARRAGLQKQVTDVTAFPCHWLYELSPVRSSIILSCRRGLNSHATEARARSTLNARDSAPWTGTLQLAAGAGSGPLGSGGREEKGPARTQAPLSHLQGPGEGKKTLCPTQVLLPSFPFFLNPQRTVLTTPPLKQLRA